MVMKALLTAALIIACVPSWAQELPDGARTRIAFTLLVDGQWDLYTSELDGSARRRLTNDSAREIAPVWSPRGDRLAYSHGQPLGRGVWVGGDGLVVVSYDGAGAKQIVTGRVIGAAFSPDGALLAYSTGQEEEGFFCSYKQFTLHVVDVESGREMMSVPDAMYPIWLPQPQSLLYLAGKEFEPRIAVPATGETRSFADASAAREGGLPITASPDGRHLYWAGGQKSESFNDVLFETDLTGNGARAIVDLPIADFRLFISDYAGCVSPRRFVRAWSPSGKDLLVTRLQRSAPGSDFEIADRLNIDVSLFTLTVVRPVGAEVTFDATPYPILLFQPGALEALRDKRAAEGRDSLIREGQIGITDAYWTPRGQGILYAIEYGESWIMLTNRLSDRTVSRLLPEFSPDQIAFIACCGL
ncbi:MAG: hypothetical protein WD036_02555 [Bauldia sp.]